MIIPDQIRRMMRTVEFWSDYFLDEVFYQQVGELPDQGRLTVPLSPSYTLRLNCLYEHSNEERFISTCSIGLRLEDTDRFLLIGQSHDDLPCLRWEEADLISRFIALINPELPHPGIPLLLLSPYVARVEHKDHSHYLQLLQYALKSLGIFNERQIRYQLASFLGHPETRESSLIRNDDWRACLQFVQRVVFHEWRPETRDVPLDALPELPACTELRYQLTRSEAAYSTLSPIRRGLFEKGLGICTIGGSWFAHEPTEDLETDFPPDAEDEFRLYCYGELGEVLAIIRQAVVEAGSPLVRLFEAPKKGHPYEFRRIPL